MKRMTRTEWLKRPVNERAAILRAAPISAWDKYLSVVSRLRRRFYRDGAVLISIGGNPAPFRVLEDAAWMKYVVSQSA